MVKSRISRSIIVLIFVVLMCFLEVYSIKYVFGKDNISDVSIKEMLAKLGYVFFLLTLTVIYTLFKDKLCRIKVKRKNALIFRYIYLISCVSLLSFFTVNNDAWDFSNRIIFLYIVIRVITSFIIKMIIFNISKSDVMSVLALFAYSMLPNIIDGKVELIHSAILTMFMASFILALQFFIDELKQIGVRTKKYLIESVIVGILAGFLTLLGINIWIFILLCFMLIFITNEMDNTHINFPKKIMAMIGRQKREKLYGIERINISKLLIGILIILAITLFINYYGNIIFENNINSSLGDYSFLGTSGLNIKLNFNDVFSKFINTTRNFINFSKTYYLIIIAYILFIEILSFVLRRRYDTKSTAIKLIFLLTISMIPFLEVNLVIFQPLFNVMLIVVAITNTSNLYLNREERVKMLVA